jgi:hypothetical protein
MNAFDKKMSQKPSLYTICLVLATVMHDGQTDKAGKPYIEHCVRVAINCETELQKCTAILHDLVEDTELSIEELRNLLSPYEIDDLTDEELVLIDQLIEAVDALTHRPDEPLEEYWSRVKECPLALYVKERDINDNTSPSRLEIFDEEKKQQLLDKYSRARKFLGLNA